MEGPAASAARLHALHAAAAAGDAGAIPGLLGAVHIVDARKLLRAVDSSGRTALDRAARGGWEAAVEMLIDEGKRANADSWDLAWIASYGPALLEAARGGHVGVIWLLLDAGASVAAADSGGRTPLWLAAAGGHKAAVRLLLKQGADRHAAAADGSLPISCAARLGHASVVQALVEPAAKADCHPAGGCRQWTAWHWCAHTGDATSARALLSEASWVAAQPVDSMAVYGVTALMVAAAAGQLDVLALLVEAGASLAARDFPDRWVVRRPGWTALHHAARHDRAGAVQALIRAGADVNVASGVDASDDEGDAEMSAPRHVGDELATPLHVAAQYAGVDLLRLLIDSGASVSVQDRSGCTAIAYAARGGCLDNIRLLLARGADALVAADGGRAVAQAVVYDQNDDSAAALLLVRSGAATPDWNMMRRYVQVYNGLCESDGENEEEEGGVGAGCLQQLGKWLAQPLREDARARAGLQQLVVGAAAAGRRAQRAERAVEEAAARTASLRAEAAALEARTAGLRAEAAAQEARIAQAAARLASLPPLRAEEGQGQSRLLQLRDAAASSAAKKPRMQ
ncbi:hypothetical protein Rsub_11892 [Raphidocelis subcapitata]|uniref:Uncharacterized protein n=1 Tax=Raphidocelis subcapitata TaxID=307507 RepID=A0A2V0PHQ9_9CHLO|nr:hypothetical protein Rsub_11892 [Raphidocelis subcapitata]|eukprot:GBF98562.1 hypothetical protein Rsub_11892 [Raphidocelis subcapitata]